MSAALELCPDFPAVVLRAQRRRGDRGFGERRLEEGRERRSREKDGKPLELVFLTSTNGPPQENQAIIKLAGQKAGIEFERVGGGLGVLLQRRRQFRHLNARLLRHGDADDQRWRRRVRASAASAKVCRAIPRNGTMTSGSCRTGVARAERTSRAFIPKQNIPVCGDRRERRSSIFRDVTRSQSFRICEVRQSIRSLLRNWPGFCFDSRFEG
ncbi:hypothetical protein ACQR1N_07220 [Bradyrhizobium sp. HKCCYLRH1073]|uniref:hypothetical protein n=1 Tax=unclassified Bradyrhizobium TaxID=2631580 RepID=UPI003EBA99C5